MVTGQCSYRPKHLAFQPFFYARFRGRPLCGGRAFFGMAVSVHVPFSVLNVLYAATAVITGMFSSAAMLRQDKPSSSRSRTTSSRRKIHFGRPTCFPAARAARMPDSVRSFKSSLSNSATQDKIPVSNLLVGFDASVSTTPCWSRFMATIPKARSGTARPFAPAAGSKPRLAIPTRSTFRPATSSDRI